MAPTHCPQCNEELGRIEQVDGKCSGCGASFEKAPTASHGEPADAPYHPSASAVEPLNLRQKESVALLVAFLVSICLPFGLIYSCYVGIQKGADLCAATGCTNDATKKVDFSGGHRIGYCEEHAHHPVDRHSGIQSLSPYALAMLALFFLAYYFVAFKNAYTGKVATPTDANRKPRDPFRRFVWVTIAGVFLMNGLYWFAARYIC